MSGCEAHQPPGEDASGRGRWYNKSRGNCHPAVPHVSCCQSSVISWTPQEERQLYLINFLEETREEVYENLTIPTSHRRHHYHRLLCYGSTTSVRESNYHYQTDHVNTLLYAGVSWATSPHKAWDLPHTQGRTDSTTSTVYYCLLEHSLYLHTMRFPVVVSNITSPAGTAGGYYC